MKAEAWMLYAGEQDVPKNASLVREVIELSSPQGREVLAKPLYGCWEANMTHALQRLPVDICKQRKEPKVVIGNAGVVRVVEVGPEVESLEPGQLAIIFCVGREDRYGYPDKILAYDAPGTMGCLATMMKMTERQLIPIPEGTQHSLPQWAAFSLRYITAWSNWELAHRVFRAQLNQDDCPAPYVFGWGGGVTYAELKLARSQGCKTFMFSGNDERLEMIERAGITAIDRRVYGELGYEEERYRSQPAYRSRYLRSEQRFLEDIRERTDGEGVHVFIDLVGGPMYRPTLKSLARQGVITTAGWKEGMQMWHLRAKECILRHQHIYTHYARYEQGVAAVAYAEAHSWMPPVSENVYCFDEIPKLAEDYDTHRTDYFPCFSVNPD